MLNETIALAKVALGFANTITIIIFLNNIMVSRRELEKWMNPLTFLLISIYQFRLKFIAYDDNHYEIILLGSISFIYLIICKRGKILEKIFWTFFMTSSFIINWSFCFSTIAFLNNRELKATIYDHKLYLLTMTISQIIQILIIYRICKGREKLRYFITKTLIFFIVLISFNLYKVHQLLVKMFHGNIMFNLEDIFFLGGVFTLTMGSIEILEIFSDQIEHITSSNIKERQNFQMKRHTQEIYEVFEKLKAWRHDWRNHLITMNYLLENREIEELKRYLDKISRGTGDMFSSIDVIKSNIPILDALFNSKAIVAKNQGIKMTVTLELNNKSRELSIDEVDLCTLIGNLLDNAIEANPEGGMIDTTIQMLKGNLIFVMENTINRKMIMRDESFITTKKEKEFHGIGLIQIDEIVKKYEGYLRRKIEKNRFITKIMIPL